MSLSNVEKIELQTAHEQKWYQRFNSRYVAPSLATLGLVVSGSASAAEGSTGLAATILGAITDEITAIGNSQKAIYGLMVVILVAFVIWRYTKRTVASA